MDAGREHDVLVARKVLGLTVYQADYTGHTVLLGPINPKYELYISTDYGWAELPEYSTDIAAAFQVVEAMRAKWACGDEMCNFWTFKDLGTSHSGETGWRVEVEFYPDHDGPAVEHEAVSQSLPHAICLAALDVLEGEWTDGADPYWGAA